MMWPLLRGEITVPDGQGRESSDEDMLGRTPVDAVPDYREEETRVVTYRIGPGQKCRSSAEARKDCEAKHGRILQENKVPYRMFFRVKKVPA